MNHHAWSAALLSLCLASCVTDRVAAPAVSCEAPRPLRFAPGVSSFCGLHHGEFAWNGTSCAAVDDAPCLCGVRVDCAPYYATLTACEVAHARCG
ncbi:MAG: hypothetical protein R3A48_29220 [Polyangiales bacterium]